jgi:hypothetical protein
MVVLDVPGDGREREVAKSAKTDAKKEKMF